ncbi:MAG: methionyl-tRNA formyltransferase, partial [Woeseiaceae bacterium]
MNINLNECRLIFAGTPHFSLPSLVALLELDISPIAVITQPDRRAGRGKQLTKSPVKVFAEEQNLEVWQPLSLSDSQFIKNIKSIKPDIVVVAAYGSIFPEKILNLPRFGCVNVH